MEWEDVGDGPIRDTTVYRTEVPGGWLYSIVAIDSVRYSGDQHSTEVTRIISTTFVPTSDEPIVGGKVQPRVGCSCGVCQECNWARNHE